MRIARKYLSSFSSNLETTCRRPHLNHFRHPGLDTRRQWYLYNQIRQFVAEPWQDVLCPLPNPMAGDDDCEESPMDVGQPQGPTTGTTNTSIASSRGDEARIRGRGRGRGTSRIKTVLNMKSPAFL